MNTEELVEAAFSRRADLLGPTPVVAAALALAARDMAARFRQGGRLLVLGRGAAGTDAQHVAVEFVHPAVVGKPALPAQWVDHHHVEVLGRDLDVLLSIGPAPDALATARGRGLLTIALVADGSAVEADHVLTVDARDPLLVKEGNVTLYHLLWELVHTFLDSPEAAFEAKGLDALYPFLSGAGTDGRQLLDAASSSARAKLDEIADLRAKEGTDSTTAIARCAEDLAGAFAGGATLFVFGNGGSSTDAQQIARTFLDPPPPAAPLAAHCLTSDVAVLTALANDVSFDVVFARQLEAFGRPGDIAVAVSTSGGSRNALLGIEAANRGGLLTVGLAGYGGGAMAELTGLQHLIAVGSSSVHRVQEVQTTQYHVLWETTSALMSD